MKNTTTEETTAEETTTEETTTEETTTEETTTEETTAEETTTEETTTEETVSVVVNGETVAFEDQAPVIKNDRTLVPLRGVLEAMGVQVEWSAEDQSVTATRGTDAAYFTVGSTELMTADGTVELDVAPEIINDRTMIPLRAVAEAFGAEVAWDDATKTVTITDSVEITSVDDGVISSEVTAEDGTVLYTVDVTYPVLNDSYTAEGKAAINEAIKASVEAAVSAESENIAASANELYASSQTEENGFEFRPLSLTGRYEVTTLSDTVVSFYFDLSSDYLGAHPTTVRTGYTYDAATGNKLTLADVTGLSAEDATAAVKTAYTELINAAPDNFLPEALENLDEALSVDDFFIEDGAVVLFAQQYAVAPYAAGFVEATLDLA